MLALDAQCAKKNQPRGACTHAERFLSEDDPLNLIRLSPAKGRILLQTIRRVLGVFASLLLLWQLVVWLTGVPPYLLPPPQLVFVSFYTVAGLLYRHALVTGAEIAAAYCIALVLGLFIGTLLYSVRSLRTLLLPALLVSQILPIFALAPLFVLWFGYGAVSKIVMAVLVCFFPVVLAVYEGLRQSPRPYVDFAASVNTPFWPLLWRVLLPAALPILTPAFKLAAVFAPLGAILGEWVGAEAGLGYLMLQASGRLRIDLLFSAIGCLALMTLCLYALVCFALKRLQPWRVDMISWEKRSFTL